MNGNQYDNLDGRLRDVEVGVGKLGQKIKDHEVLEARNFEQVNDKLEDVASALGAINVSLAYKKGAVEEAKKHGGTSGAKWGVLVSTIIAGLGACAQQAGLF